MAAGIVTERIDYVDAAAVLAETLRAIDPGEPWTVVGHSMGGKTAMVLALTEPDLVERLAVVDISPAPTASFTEFETFLAGMRALDLDSVSSRADADEAMREAVAAANAAAQRGDTVLLAPAAASLDMYASYGARGDAFADAVAALSGSGA